MVYYQDLGMLPAPQFMQQQPQQTQQPLFFQNIHRRWHWALSHSIASVAQLSTNGFVRWISQLIECAPTKEFCILHVFGYIS
jgi:hypothetical protein